MWYFIQITLLFAGLLIVTVVVTGQNSPDSVNITTAEIQATEGVIGIEFTAAERDTMLQDVESNVEYYQKLRALDLPNSQEPALYFNPIPPGMTFSDAQREVRYRDPGTVSKPDHLEDLAFYTISELSGLIREQKVTSVELTQLFLDRLREHDKSLYCVVTLTEELALAQAQKMDAEVSEGKYRGPLHGIPYGIKDLFAVEGYKTTWGAVPYQEQVIDKNSTVFKRLEEAGAVLVAKLTLGALAWGDVWFGGKTRNPWNPEQGSSGSSAGAAAATAAGLVPFAIGTETWGSIVSPSTRCGTTGLRPTFGRVSRTGAMALSWSMDKIGPLTRSVEDCAIVFNAIYGPDGKDKSVVDLPFNYNTDRELNGIRVGYAESLFEGDYPNKEQDQATLNQLRALGVKPIPITLPDYPVEPLSFILSAEAAAAFQELTLSDRDSLMVRQIRNAWPNVFRASNLIPAVEYIQANRARNVLIRKMAEIMNQVDVYVAPSFGGDNLLLTNLTGHPCVVLPNGFSDEGNPGSISFIGQLYDEGTLLTVAKHYQESTGFHEKHPGNYR